MRPLRLQRAKTPFPSGSKVRHRRHLNQLLASSVSKPHCTCSTKSLFSSYIFVFTRMQPSTSRRRISSTAVVSSSSSGPPVKGGRYATILPIAVRVDWCIFCMRLSACCHFLNASPMRIAVSIPSST